MSDESKERAKLIEQILDKMMPIPENAPDNIKESIERDRQMLVMRAGFNNMSAQELKSRLNK